MHPDKVTKEKGKEENIAAGIDYYSVQRGKKSQTISWASSQGAALQYIGGCSKKGKKRGKYAGAEKFLPRRRRSLSRAEREGEIAIEKQEAGENEAPL